MNESMDMMHPLQQTRSPGFIAGLFPWLSFPVPLPLLVNTMLVPPRSERMLNFPSTPTPPLKHLRIPIPLYQIQQLLRLYLSSVLSLAIESSVSSACYPQHAAHVPRSACL